METRLDVQMSTVVSHDTKLKLSDSEVFSAMRAGNKEILEKMKRCTTPIVCYKNDKGDSILHVAASFGHLELVKSIVSECPSLLLEQNLKGRIPLHMTACAGRSEVIKVLAASIEHPYVFEDINGDTPLHLAMKDLHEKTEELRLIEKQRIRMQGSLFHVLRCRSISEYFTEAYKSLMETALYLVNANQCVSFAANKEGISPLYLAVKVGNLSLVNAMLSRPFNSVQGEFSNIASQLKGRKSLVHVALRAKKIDVLDVILNEDPSLVNERDEEGRTCISVGASLGFYEGIHMVLDRSTSGVFECDDDGSFPIHRAVEKGHENVVKELLKRCPDSIEQLNKDGQNVLHIAAKSGKGILCLMDYIKELGTKNHLIKEQDVDGNTPLHLATINWRPRAIGSLTSADPPRKKLLDILNKDEYLRLIHIQNNSGLRPLDIAHKALQHAYVFRERMTLMVLLRLYKPEGVSWIPTTGITLRSSSKRVVGDETIKHHINFLALMAALIATVTFAACFTMPGGFNSSAPNIGMAILVDDLNLSLFLVCDTLAMQFSIIAIVTLVWAQLGDQELAHKAFHVALPSLFVALWCMSFAFVFGVLATIQTRMWLGMIIGIISAILTAMMVILLTPYIIPQLHGIPALDLLSRGYLGTLLWFVNEEDAETQYTFGSGGTLKRFTVHIKDRFLCCFST